jgi:hypothetical protein
VGLGSVAARARVLVHEASQAEKIALRRRGRSVDHAGLKVEEHRAGHVLAARGLVIKHIDAVESSLVYFLLPICKESKKAHYAQALMAHAVCSSAPLSGAAPFLGTRLLG